MEKQAKLVELNDFRSPANGEVFYYTVKDGTKIRVAIWNKNALNGTIILQSGRTEFIEKYYEVIEFDSSDSSLVGDTIYISSINLNINNDYGSMYLDGVVYEKFKNYNSTLSGSWLMSGIERGGEIRMRDVNRSRKTMKMLAGGRFQWIAYDIDKKGFYGTGGGIFTSENGNYIENIEFFSRDNSKVGISLELNFEVKEGDWHHKGFSSKGDTKYEIWTQRKQ